jgi:hypothetical protein
LDLTKVVFVLSISACDTLSLTILPTTDAVPLPNPNPNGPSEDHVFDLSDSFSPAESPRVGSPVGSDRPPSRNLLSRLKRKAAPNLTECISGIEYTHFAGGYSDIYSGVFTTSRGSELVALKLLRVVNKKSNNEKVKKVSVSPIAVLDPLRLKLA